MTKKSPDGAIPAPGTPRKARRPKAKRLASLDAFRGFIMIMLAADGFGIADLASLPPDNSVWTRLDFNVWQRVGFHFSHPPWESVFGWGGVAFWDLIQPAFMFMGDDNDRLIDRGTGVDAGYVCERTCFRGDLLLLFLLLLQF